jgi:hypothetical protein
VAVLVVAFVGLSLLLWRLRAAGAGNLVGPIVLLLALAECLALTPAAMLSLGGTAGMVDRMISLEQAAARRPWFQSRRETFVQQRTFEQDLEVHWPFAILAPAVFKTASAYQSPIFINSVRMPTTSHFFRLLDYETLVTNHDDDHRLKEVLGVTRPVLELMSPYDLHDMGGALLARLASGRASSESNEIAPGTHRVIVFDGDRLVLEIETPEAAVLVYRDNMADGWSAAIDGRESEILLVDAVNKAVAVPPGRHEVVFTYRPWPYLAAFALRALILAAAALACARTAMVAILAHRREAMDREC